MHFYQYLYLRNLSNNTLGDDFPPLMLSTWYVCLLLLVRLFVVNQFFVVNSTSMAAPMKTVSQTALHRVTVTNPTNVRHLLAPQRSSQQTTPLLD